MTQGLLVYWSSKSENTHRFVEKLGFTNTLRLPIAARQTLPKIEEPYVIMTPTYGGGHKDDPETVPKPVIEFINDNVTLLRGVIAAGNTSFGSAYCIAGNFISARYNVPYLYRFELLGTQLDVANVQLGLANFWDRQ